ncbi:unnamed protein product, partial [marine sediment metagenome]
DYISKTEVAENFVDNDKAYQIFQRICAIERKIDKFKHENNRIPPSQLYDMFDWLEKQQSQEHRGDYMPRSVRQGAKPENTCISCVFFHPHHHARANCKSSLLGICSFIGDILNGAEFYVDRKSLCNRFKKSEADVRATDG